MTANTTFALILAAGKGTRMYSDKPKVLQMLGGKPIIAHLIDTLHSINIAHIGIIYGYKGEMVKEALHLQYQQLEWIEQKKQLGTGHAVLQALPLLQREGITLILLGDVPLLRAAAIEKLLTAASEIGAALLTAVMDNSKGYGRIIRADDSAVAAIVEDKDCSDEQRAIREINTGVMAVSNSLLREYLPKISNDNVQQEYYLTDLIGLLYQAGHSIAAVIADDPSEVGGINNRVQLSQAEAIYRMRQTNALLEAGVTLLDPNRIDLHGTVAAGQDVLLEANVMLKGTVRLGNRVVIETGCVLTDCDIGDDVTVHAYSIIENAKIEARVQIGPFARIRPETHLFEGSKIGNFVEVKSATVGQNSKVNHLSYIGNAVLGANVNVGAGTITCNYDGLNKWQTTVGDYVFIGSNTALVAPVSLGDGSTIGAGSIITKNVEANALALTRASLKTKSDWHRPSKKQKPN